MGGTSGVTSRGSAGSSGSDGAPPSIACTENPIGPKSEWTASALVFADECDTNPNPDYCGPPDRAIDGIANNCFTTGRARMGNEWLQIDFSKNVTTAWWSLAEVDVTCQ